MSDPVRYFFDQHMPSAVARGLTRRGVDVLTAQDAGRCSLPDEDHVRFATASGRVIVTFDTDYLVLAAGCLANGEPFSGIVWCPEQKYSYGELISELHTLHGVFTAADMLNHVEYL